MGQDCSDCARLQVERASALKATHDLEKVLLREGDVEGAYERRLAEAVRTRNELLEALEDAATQLQCGCGHPSCGRCKDSSYYTEVIAKAKGVP